MAGGRKGLRGPCPDQKGCKHLEDLRRKLLEARQQMHFYRDKLQVETEKRERTEEQLLTDPLTGAFNRNGLEKRFLEECSKAERFKSKKLFMIFLDIDDFKKFNDEHGENTGDIVLQRVVKTISENIRPYDSVYRIGGEEFVIIMPEMRALKTACRAAERIRKKIERLKVVPFKGGEGLSITVSIGMARLGSGDSLDTLIDKANEAELEAKRTGKNRGYVYLGGEVLPIDQLIKSGKRR